MQQPPLDDECACTPADEHLTVLRAEIEELLAALGEAESAWSFWLESVASELQSSARNLVHYWAIRQHDLRDLQPRLAALGLSSLGRSESHVEATLLAVRAAISAMLPNSASG